MKQIDSVSPILPVRSSPEAASQTQPLRRTRPLEGRPPSSESEAVPEKRAEANAVSGIMRDVTLRYKVDPDTGTLSLLIIDRKSRKVIRAVPPEELSRMGVNHVFDGLV